MHLTLIRVLLESENGDHQREKFAGSTLCQSRGVGCFPLNERYHHCALLQTSVGEGPEESHILHDAVNGFEQLQHGDLRLGGDVVHVLIRWIPCLRAEHQDGPCHVVHVNEISCL